MISAIVSAVVLHGRRQLGPKIEGEKMALKLFSNSKMLNNKIVNEKNV
jgi:hypothetical protein